ncbi:MAG TPA: nuclear transport factor 2 family protein [Rhizomicrobium sp.]|nr:nuclear transport factor 2 family protein [Rhizomicrobium sp.]
MNHTFNRTVLLCLALAFAAPASSAPADDLIATDKAFSALSAAQGSNAAFLAFLADDGRIFGTGNDAPIYSRADALARFKASTNGDPKTNVLSWAPDNAEVSADGTMGYTDGHWLFVGPADDEGTRPRTTGHYVTVWRMEDGQWKVIADMGTTDPDEKK